MGFLFNWKSALKNRRTNTFTLQLLFSLGSYWWLRGENDYRALLSSFFPFHITEATKNDNCGHKTEYTKGDWVITTHFLCCCTYFACLAVNQLLCCFRMNVSIFIYLHSIRTTHFNSFLIRALICTSARSAAALVIKPTIPPGKTQNPNFASLCSAEHSIFHPWEKKSLLLPFESSFSSNMKEETRQQPTIFYPREI